MSYTIYNTDGSTLVLLPDNTVDQVSTSLALIGKNFSGYGEYYNNNLVKLLGNFADSASNPPRNPVRGQLWYETTSKKLKIYDNSFKSVSGATISSVQPADLSVGDFWFDTTNNQLKMFTGNDVFTVAPQFTKTIGETGWTLPQPNIKDEFNDSQNVVLFKSYGEVVGVISKVAFDVNPTDAQTYFNTPNFRINKGMGIIGDINFTGQITNNHLSMQVDIDFLLPAENDVTDYTGDFISQNVSIATLLTKMFPPVVNELTKDPGVPLNTEARVLCKFTVPTNGYQVRRFRYIEQVGVGASWQPFNIYSNGRNVVP